MFLMTWSSHWNWNPKNSCSHFIKSLAHISAVSLYALSLASSSFAVSSHRSWLQFSVLLHIGFFGFQAMFWLTNCAEFSSSKIQSSSNESNDNRRPHLQIHTFTFHYLFKYNPFKIYYHNSTLPFENPIRCHPSNFCPRTIANHSIYNSETHNRSVDIQCLPGGLKSHFG